MLYFFQDFNMSIKRTKVDLVINQVKVKVNTGLLENESLVLQAKFQDHHTFGLVKNSLTIYMYVTAILVMSRNLCSPFPPYHGSYPNCTAPVQGPLSSLQVLSAHLFSS